MTPSLAYILGETDDPTPEPYQLHLGDCLEVLKTLPDNSVDGIVTDPPYGIDFMAKKWDSFGREKEYKSRGGYNDKGVMPGYGRGGTSEQREKYRRKSNLAFQEFSYEWAVEALRVLKPGGHMLVFGGTRTYHRMAVGVEDAGFELRDTVMWCYGSGFPKSRDVSKDIDKMGSIDSKAFKESLSQYVAKCGMTRKMIDEKCGFTMRFDTQYSDDPIGWGVSLPSPEKWKKVSEVLGIDEAEWQPLIDRVWRGRSSGVVSGNISMTGGNYSRTDKGAPITDAAKQFAGYGTSLKPAYEPIILCRKPLEGTVAANVLKHGTGALNIDGCRVDAAEGRPLREIDPKASANGAVYAGRQKAGGGFDGGSKAVGTTTQGRFPANLIHDNSDEVLACFPDSKSCNSPSKAKPESKFRPGQGNYQPQGEIYPGETGSAARFFKACPDTDPEDDEARRLIYCAKASKKDRNEGCESMPLQTADPYGQHRGRRMEDNDQRFDGKPPSKGQNTHPTVKPTLLMRYLVKLLAPPGDAVILDPFLGSGSTGKACMLEGIRFIGIEREEEYMQIARARIAHAAQSLVE